MKNLEILLIFLSVFLITFIVDYFFINKKKLYLIKNNGINKKGKKKKIKSISEIDYLVNKFHLKKKDLEEKRVILWISIINSFIISFTSAIVMIIPLKIMWQMFIAFGLLFALIYSLYEIYGRHITKIDNKNKDKKKHYSKGK